jgi:hypothetical protein
MKLTFTERILGVVVTSLVLVILALMPDVDANRITAIAGIGVAAATLVLALVTVSSIEESRRQAQRAQRSLNHPVLIPTSPLNQDIFFTADSLEIAFNNAGHGVAYNAYSVFIPAQPINKLSLPRQFPARYPVPYKAGDTNTLYYSLGGTRYTFEDKIQDISLTVPKELAPEDGIPNSGDSRDRIIGRLTVTYADIFGVYSACVYDFTKQALWLLVANLDEIPFDLHQMDVQKSVSSPSLIPIN